MEKDEGRELLVPWWMGIVVVGVCVIAVAADLWLQRSLSGLAIVALGYAVALVAIPHVEWIKVGPTGLVARTVRQEREKAEKAANQAELAARIAWVVSSTQAVMYENQRGRLQDIRAVRRVFADAANTDRPITVADTAGIWEYDEEEYGQKNVVEYLCHRHEEMWKQFEEEGIVQLSGVGEELEARVAPEYKDAIIQAFSHRTG